MAAFILDALVCHTSWLESGIVTVIGTSSWCSTVQCVSPVTRKSCFGLSEVGKREAKTGCEKEV